MEKKQQMLRRIPAERQQVEKTATGESDRQEHSLVLSGQNGDNRYAVEIDMKSRMHTLQRIMAA